VAKKQERKADNRKLREHSLEDVPLSGDNSDIFAPGDDEQQNPDEGNSAQDPVLSDLRQVTNHRADDIFPFAAQLDEDDEHVFIEFPGATLYEPDTDNIIAGVQFVDDDDPSAGYRIVGKTVFPPTHTRWRRIKRDALGSIRRCQACQDYTVRNRRREGADFFIPSVKHPKRKKLKSISHNVTD